MHYSRITLAALSILAISTAASAQTLGDLPPASQASVPAMAPTPASYQPQAPATRAFTGDHTVASNPGFTIPKKCWRLCAPDEGVYCSPTPQNGKWVQGCWIQSRNIPPTVPANPSSFEYFDVTGTVRYHEGDDEYAGPTSSKPTWQQAHQPNPRCTEVPHDVNYTLVQPTQGGGAEICTRAKDPSGFEKVMGVLALGLTGYAISQDNGYYGGYYGSGYYQSSAYAMSRGGSQLTYGGAPRR